MTNNDIIAKIMTPSGSGRTWAERGGMKGAANIWVARDYSLSDLVMDLKEVELSRRKAARA